MSLAQVLPTTNTGVGTGTGLAQNAAAILNISSSYIGADAQDYRLICRVCGTNTFRLAVLTTDGTTTAVVKQAASATVSVDGGTATYVNAAELDIPFGSNMRVQIWCVGAGTVDWIYDWRIYQAGA